MNLEKAALLAERGRMFLDRKEFVKAEKSFLGALKEVEDPVVRNNLAMSRYLQDKPEAALRTLEGFEGEMPNPYRKSLMAQCLAELGRMDEARPLVRAAVRDFEKIERMKDTNDAWREYTVMVMRAAGAIGDHRQVLELYKRWQRYHINWENKYLAGVAAFNLKRFRQAGSYWSGIKEYSYAHKLQLICLLAEHGVVPPFILEYKLMNIELLNEAAREENYKGMVAANGMLRMFILISVFDEDSKEIMGSSLDTLIVYGGDWGKSFGLELLEAAMIPEEVKMEALHALVRAGVFAEGEGVPVIINGEERLITVSQVEVTWEPGQEILDTYNKAVTLRDMGKEKEALQLVKELNTGRVIFPPALLVQANLHRNLNERDKALMLLETLEKVDPEHPIFLYNLAGFWLDIDDRKKAKIYADRIDTSQTTQEFKEKVDRMRFAIEFDIEGQMGYYRELQRIEYEDRTLPTETTIARGLKNMPVQWVREACAFWQVGCEYRKDGEAALVETAGDPANIQPAILRLEEDERELLSYLLDKGGFVRVSAVSRKFGSMEGEGFLGESGPPRSALGRLWLKGFVFVGRALLNGRNTKIAAIPVEMRDELRRLFIGEALF